ncbi:MAG: DUF2807 domain-containing protein [Dehalococcoidales bacterium]|nr:DUF2807 domain-containing protein [Dehalococcoidales bacterium]
MKKLLLPLTGVLIMLASLVLPGCSESTGEGEVITEKKSVTAFDILDIGSAFELVITRAETYDVTISADEDLIDYIEVTQTGNRLKVYLSPHHSFTDFTLGDRMLKAEIMMPSLKGLEVSGACNGKVTGFRAMDDLALVVSGATQVDLDGNDIGNITGEVSGASRITGNLTAKNVALSVAGASSLELYGSGISLNLDVSGASRADMSRFKAGAVGAKVSGASEATVFAEESLDVDVSGASRLYFLGNPVLGDTNISGASTIKHKD